MYEDTFNITTKIIYEESQLRIVSKKVIYTDEYFKNYNNTSLSRPSVGHIEFIYELSDYIDSFGKQQWKKANKSSMNFNLDQEKSEWERTLKIGNSIMNELDDFSIWWKEEMILRYGKDYDGTKYQIWYGMNKYD